MADSPMLDVESAEKVIAGFPVTVRSETVPLAAAHDRFLAEDQFAPRPMPEFDKSAMDGYALIAGDTSPAYRIVDTIAAGSLPKVVITPGQCARIMTGAMLPAGADRVIRRERTREEGDLMRIIAEDGNLNIRRRGEDLEAGKLFLSKGIRLRSPQIALLASMGAAGVPVARPPRTGIITTGSELSDPGAPLAPGRIYDSNSFSLAAQLRETGVEPLALGHVDDREADIVKAVRAGLERCDVLILSGGVSAGDYDFVPQAMKNAGLSLLFEKIAVQPGMPTVFASLGAKAAFGLPGNPVSTFVIFEIFIKPLLLRWMGHFYRPLVLPAVLVGGFRRAHAERTAFVPVTWRDGRADPVAYHGSAHLHALSRANGLLRVPAGQDAIPPGSAVHVRLI